MYSVGFVHGVDLAIALYGTQAMLHPGITPYFPPVKSAELQ